MRVVVAGGGIAGLGAAKARLEAGDAVIIIDQNNSLGGLSRSFKIGDFTFDYTGHLFHLNKTNSLSDISPHLNDEEWSSQKKYSGAFWNNQLIDAPFQYNLHQLQQEDQERLRASYQAMKKTQQEIHSFSDYLIKNFGSALAQEFLIPYNTKMLGTDLNRISYNAVTRFFPPPDKNLLLGKKIQEVKTYNSNFYYPKKTGIGLLVEALVRDIKEYQKLSIVTGEKILAIDSTKHEIYTDKGKYTYDIVISSIPLHKMGEIVHDPFLTNNKILSTSKVFCLHIGYSEPIQLFEKYHWVYFPEEDLPMYRIGFYSKFNDYMAPQGMESAYIECGFDGRAGIQIPAQTELILNHMEERFGFKKTSLRIMVCNIIYPGFVHYTHDRSELIETIIQKLRSNDILQIGRYGLWYYNSMEDSYYSGYRLCLA